jgi:glucokinase
MRKPTNVDSFSPPFGGVGGGYTIAIDLGGTIIKIGLLNEGHLIDRSEIVAQSASGLKLQLPELEAAINQILLTNQVQKENVLGIGFSFAGLVDSVQNRILSTNQKYDDGPETDLVSWALEKWNWPLFAMNDARMALLGEWQHGAGKGYTELVAVTLGTGIGTAVLMNGELLIGKHFQSGNLGGHFVVNHNGTRCTCGNIGCVEAEASTWRLPSLLKEHPKFSESSIKDEEVLDFRALFSHAATNDLVANEVLEHCLSVWSAGIISMIHAFDPEMIILSGGIMKSSAIILPVLQEKVDQLAWTPWGKVKLVEAKYPDSAALYGADYLVRSSVAI